MVAKTAGHTFQQCLGICHFIVIRENPLSCNIAEGNNASPLIQGIHVPGGTQNTVQRHGRNIKGFLVEPIIKFGIALSFSEVEAHADVVKNKVDSTAKMLHALREEIFKIVHVGHICSDNGCIDLLRQFIDLTHSQCNGSVGQYDFCTLRMAGKRCFPGNGLLIQCAKNDSFFSFEQLIGHS